MIPSEVDFLIPAPTIEVLHPGALTTIQDLGRPGLAHLGVPRSGAADARSLRLANRIVGNPDGAACLETTLMGPRLRLYAGCMLALTGAPVSAALDGVPVPMNSVVTADAGATLKLSAARAGLRTYIAFGGGVDAVPVLGSRSADLRSAIGPPRLALGDLITLGADHHLEPAPEGVTGDESSQAFASAVHEPSLRVQLGPREDWFTRAAVEALTSQAFTVSAQSDRVGVRLQCRSLERAEPRELRSEGIAAGSIQVPPDGQPIIMLADHPTTGGYPVIAVVRSEDLWLVGQLRPGRPVRFTL